MSFLGDLVNSIDTGKAPVLARPTIRPPIVPNVTPPIAVPATKSVPSLSTVPTVGTKRKLDDRETNPISPSDQFSKPVPVSTFPIKPIPRPSSQLSNGIKPIPKSPAVSAVVPSSVPAKPPSKGSYAEMMARAKEAQQSRTQNPLGTIKHQAVTKEKISKLAERRRLEQEKLKTEKEKKTDKASQAGKIDRKRGVSPVKKSETTKIARPARPPLHAPASSYKGTMGKASNKPRDERTAKKSRYDDYLGTDEEDNSEIDDYGDDGYGYGSDASSDMEAGLDDIDLEEKVALKAAKEDDARELAYETELKREKEDRKRRLQAMAKKSR